METTVKEEMGEKDKIIGKSKKRGGGADDDRLGVGLTRVGGREKMVSEIN